jgi:hypothetical protein
MSFYLFWSAVVASGAAFRLVDGRWIKRPVLGLLAPAGVPIGVITTQASPFNFADGGLYMQGVLLSAASALALISYVLTWVSVAVWCLVQRRRAGRASTTLD